VLQLPLNGHKVNIFLKFGLEILKLLILNSNRKDNKNE